MFTYKYGSLWRMEASESLQRELLLLHPPANTVGFGPDLVGQLWEWRGCYSTMARDCSTSRAWLLSLNILLFKNSHLPVQNFLYNVKYQVCLSPNKTRTVNTSEANVAPCETQVVPSLNQKNKTKKPRKLTTETKLWCLSRFNWSCTQTESEQSKILRGHFSPESRDTPGYTLIFTHTHTHTHTHTVFDTLTL